MYLTGATCCSTDAFNDSAWLKEQIGALGVQPPRRVLPAGLLAILGALSLRKQVGSFPAHAALVLAKETVCDTAVNAVLEQIYAANELPYPLDFINTMSSVSTYHLAALLNLTDMGLTVEHSDNSFIKALLMLDCAMRCGLCTGAVLGWVSYDGTSGTSAWFLLSAGCADQTGVPKITLCKEMARNNESVTQSEMIMQLCSIGNGAQMTRLPLSYWTDGIRVEVCTCQ